MDDNSKQMEVLQTAFDKLSSTIFANVSVTRAFMLYYFLNQPDAEREMQNFTDLHLADCAIAESKGEMTTDDLQEIRKIFKFLMDGVENRGSGNELLTLEDDLLIN